MITVKEAVIRARSARAFDEKQKVTKGALEEMIDCARLCPSAANLQPLKYRLILKKNEIEKLMPLTKWAAYFKDIKLPPKGNNPTAFIIILHDESIAPQNKMSQIDIGICAQTINLAAREKGYGACMLGGFEPEKISKAFELPENLSPALIIALGVPAEKEAIISSSESPDGIKYFRGEDGVHYVPKRPIDEIIVK